MSTTLATAGRAAEATASRKVTTALYIETPENVVLNYQLAGPTVRGLAYLLDLLVRLAIILVLGLFLMFAANLWSGGVSSGMFLVLLFFIDWFYFVFSEVYFHGKSIGKHALGLRVIHVRGYPVSFWPSCLRNLLRAADSLPFLFHGVGFISILVTKRGQRLGDLVARTVVIAERPVRLPKEPIILEKIQPLPRAELVGSYVPTGRTLATIEDFLGRRFVLSHDRGHALAGPLAVRLAERLNFQGDPKLVQKYPMAFLARVYVTFLERVEEDEEITGTDSLIAQSSVHLGPM